MEHPALKRIMRTGYAEPERKVIRSDAMNQPIFLNDEILCIEDIEFVVEDLSSEAIEVLEMLGATYEKAE